MQPELASMIASSNRFVAKKPIAKTTLDLYKTRLCPMFQEVDSREL